MDLPASPWTNANQGVHPNRGNPFATAALNVPGPVFNNPFDGPSAPNGTWPNDSSYSSQPVPHAGYVPSFPNLELPQRLDAGTALSHASVQDQGEEEDEDEDGELEEEWEEDVVDRQETEHQTEHQGIANKGEAKKPRTGKSGVTRSFNDRLQ